MSHGAEELLRECRAAGSALAVVMELAVVTESVLQELGPYAMVAVAGIEALREREPGLYQKVAEWLHERGMTLVQV